MRFLMIDRICDLEPGVRARGIKNITLNDGFLTEEYPGLAIYPPMILCEAVAQLVSWLIIEARDFTVKPVITVVETFSVFQHPRPGDRLEVTGEVESMSPESALAHGSVLLNGKPVITLQHAVCYLYPLEELDPPAEARRQFANIYRQGDPLPETDGRVQLARETMPVGRRQWIDQITVDGTPDRLEGIHNVSRTEDYFRDHFPRKPILPGVVMLEIIGDLAEELIRRNLAAENRQHLRPVLTHSPNFKFRPFVEPGDQVVVQALRKEQTDTACTVAVKGLVGGKPAAMGTLCFDLLDHDTYRRTRYEG